MARKDSDNQKKSMSAMFRGRAIFKPLNTGRIDKHVACVREWVANIFFYTKNDLTIMIDAGYNYARLQEKMQWLDIDPASIGHILITHQDTDHVGALEEDSELLFRDATVYIGEIENRYLTGETRRKVIHGLYKLPMVKMGNRKVLLRDGEIFHIGDIKIECILVPGHTWGHMVYLIDDEYLFTGDTIWFGADGGYSFISTLAEDNKLALRSLEHPRAKGPHCGDHRAHRLDGRSGLCLCPQGGDLQALHQAIFRPGGPLRRLRGGGGHGGRGADRAAFQEEAERRRSDMTRKEQIRSAYRLTGGNASFYDGMMTYSTLPGKAICRIVWNMDGEKNLRYLERALSGVPEDFSGKLLEVPVGTGVLTMPVYRYLPEAQITCLDYSLDMMAAAQERAKKAGIGNVRFVQGDVGALPFPDESFDIVLSLNGFHAFPDKEAAYRETFRVLNPGGTFCGCFYVQGGCSRTDWFIRHLYQPKGFFTPPYETETSLRQRLSKLYRSVNVTSVEGMGCFRCVK